MKSRHSQTYPPGLYLIATPIGNLGDISNRALEVLAQMDMILCEDTRVSGKLLSHYGIKGKLVSYNDHNAGSRRPHVLADIADGKRLGLISDAGTPLVSDPGYKLVREVIDAGLYVTAIPGASSVLMALCLSGLPSDRFFFAGFLPTKSEACRKELESLSSIPGTLIFFESAKRLTATLAIMQRVLGNRPAAVLRELTKLFEEARRGTLQELHDYYESNGEPKGEVVIVVGPPLAKAASEEDLTQKLKLLLKTHGVKEAASLLAEESGRPRKELYSLALSLMKNDD